MYDIIGDIHGYCDELEVMLESLGYEEIEGSWVHSEGRKVIFVGDYIDRGPKILETIRLVRKMVEYGQAIALMGNHEFNALAYHIRKPNGDFCRPHTPKNMQQHGATLEQMEGHEHEFKSHLDWFMTLPLFVERDGLRAVHACWDNHNIKRIFELLQGNKLRDTSDIIEATTEGSELFQLVEETLKGKELKLPEGASFKDKDGHERSEIRIKWWEDPKQISLREYSVVELPSLPESKIINGYDHYNENEPPVFFGHYWLTGEPFLQKDNVCCLDYSIAKGGELVAYHQFEGEQKLSNYKFVSIANE